jgi:Superinfection immunity protein
MGNIVLFAQQNPPDDATATAIGAVALACGGIVCLLIYFLPTFIAWMRGHQNTFAIVVLNILAGWTFIGWVAALVWACTTVQREPSFYAKTPSLGESQPATTPHGDRRPTSSNTTLLIILGVFAGMLVLGCPCGIGLLVPAVQRVREAADRTARLNELSQIGKAIHSFHDTTKRMPAKLDDIQPSLNAMTMQRLRNGEIEVIWNAVPLPEEDRGTSNVMMAWDTKPAGNGDRLVLFMDGSVQVINENAFHNAAKARTQPKKDEKKTKDEPKKDVSK